MNCKCKINTCLHPLHTVQQNCKSCHILSFCDLTLCLVSLPCWETDPPRSRSILADCIRLFSRIFLYFAAFIYIQKPTKPLCREASTQRFLISVIKPHIESALTKGFKKKKERNEIGNLLSICVVRASQLSRMLTVIVVHYYQGHGNCLCESCTRMHAVTQTTHRTEPHLFHSAAFALFLLIQIDLSCH